MAECLQLSSFAAPIAGRIGVSIMKGTAKEEWTQLCEQAAVEEDPEKLMILVKQIIRMLDEKEQRLKDRNSEAPSGER